MTLGRVLKSIAPRTQLDLVQPLVISPFATPSLGLLHHPLHKLGLHGMASTYDFPVPLTVRLSGILLCLELNLKGLGV